MPEKTMEDMFLEGVEDFFNKNIKGREAKRRKNLLFVSQITWSLNETICPCDYCDQIYQDWLNLGKALYKNNISAYEKKVEEANLRREQRKEERKLSKPLGRGSQRLVNAYS